MKAVELIIRDLPPSNVPATISGLATAPLKPIDSLTVTIAVEATLCLQSLQEIVTSWSSIRHLGFQFYQQSSSSANAVIVGVEQFLGLTLI